LRKGLSTHSARLLLNERAFRDGSRFAFSVARRGK
jgi:hypothetical protein